MPTLRYDRDTLPEHGWGSYRKKTVTRMTPIDGPCVIETQEGDYFLPEGWDGFLALDAEGWPYPLVASVHQRSYEPVEMTA